MSKIRTKEEEVMFNLLRRAVTTYSDIAQWPEYNAFIRAYGYLGNTQPRPTTTSEVDEYVDAKLKALKEREESANFASRAALAIDIRKFLDRWVKEES